MTTLPKEAMTAERAAFFLQRFKNDEKMLGPNEQAAIDFALASLVQHGEQPVAYMAKNKNGGTESLIRARLLEQIGRSDDHDYLMRTKSIKGFRTGDMVRATVPTHNAKGKPVAKSGNYTGRVAVRASGAFNIQTPAGVIDSISHKYCTVIMRGDGYSYSTASNYQSHSRSSPTKLDGSASRTTPTRPANLEGVPCEKT